MPPAASASFIAVQCFQCSTMQVKQQKKSSNKWTCVVCNEKQSVRKVYAQGAMAKDVRKFVQSFNMSRKYIDEEGEENLSSSMVVSDAAGEAAGSCPGNERKRRNDWSEYLDPPEEEEEETDIVEGEILKGKPIEMMMLKKKKKNHHQSESSTTTGLQCSKLKPLPLFPKRRNTIIKMMKAEKKIISKWSEYLTEEEEEENEETTTMSALDIQAAAAAITQHGNNDSHSHSHSHSHMVEDEIHPHFM